MVSQPGRSIVGLRNTVLVLLGCAARCRCQDYAVIVMERNSYGLGYYNRQLDSRNQSFPICKRNQISNTKGSKLVPYSGRLKYISVELSNFILNWWITSSTISKQDKHTIYWCYIYSCIYNQQCISIWNHPWIKYSFKHILLDRKKYFY